MNPAPGDRASGLNVVFDKLGVGFLANQWWQHPDWGAAALALPAVWASAATSWRSTWPGSGRARGPARGGAHGRRLRVPCTGTSSSRTCARSLAALIILGHISIKVFDLIVAIGGKQLVTEVPAVYMWVLIYDARDYAKGAAIATLLLVGISILIIPYLVYTVRSERRA